ncbi:Lon protease-like protein [Natronocella acetinitrilica]|uniref:Lon protease-like protein n=1 Tax=Natronocella acetinitrilica TaxID=414046 RepID=A0AAE3G4N8_9GAMM|nr:LON peptidase substrate-binding domain-containing protein [Natronocella acetinitrilica]MCP1675098.1 Lon protease-like protein [Natronocella acetinitrilica]
MMRIPIFPLRTVLFPGGPLQLRIFETRYLDMVSQCLREDRGFGVCLIQEGNEIGEPAHPHPVGTIARIVDWDKRPDGLLGLTAIGGERFRIRSMELAKNRLLWAQVEPLSAEQSPPLPEQPAELTRMLDQVLALPGLGYEHTPRADGDADWLSCRLAEILPLRLEDRQRLLTISDPMIRLQSLQSVIPALRLGQKDDA